MDALIRLRAALRETNSSSLRGLTFDTKLLDQETSRLRAWLGDRGTGRPPLDAITVALHAFYREQRLGDLRQARLVCFGCIERLLPDDCCLLEDVERFPKLLRAVDAYVPFPRAYRRCYYGLLNAYFVYDPKVTSITRLAGRENWEELRRYLRDRVTQTTTPGVLPTWVEVLQANVDLLGNDPGHAYGDSLLNGELTEFERARVALDIPENSWLIWNLVLGQIDAATRQDDTSFQGHLPRLLELLSKHSLATSEGLARVLTRYHHSKAPVVHDQLRDFAVAQWGNPWLPSNSPKWSKVDSEVRKMVTGWLKLRLIQQFFELLAADSINDRRRLQFWASYHDSIDDMYFALGRTARASRQLEFQDIRQKMEGRILQLHSAGSPDNNAFIMCIGDFVVVEFGVTGNACYIFKKNQLPFELQGDVAGNGTALKHTSSVQRLLHQNGSFEEWEDSFRRTIASVMGVTPQTQPIQHDVSPVQTSDLSIVGRRPYSVRPHTDTRPARHRVPSRPRGEAESQQRAAFEQELARLSDTHGLPIEDFRPRHSYLWVRTDDTNEYVNNKLRSWGFSFKPGKGWWR